MPLRSVKIVNQLGEGNIYNPIMLWIDGHREVRILNNLMNTALAVIN